MGHRQACDAVNQNGIASCRACHGADDSGTVLSYAQGDRSFNTQFGVKNFWRGFRVSCYACHDGPNDDDAVNNAAPAVTNLTSSTPNDASLVLNLSGTDADNDPLSFRIVSQPERGQGTVGINGTTVTFYPEPGFTGLATFTYAAWDGKINSNLGTVDVTVTAAACGPEVTTFGFGCPGAGGVMPSLTLTGCPNPGSFVDLVLGSALGARTRTSYSVPSVRSPSFPSDASSGRSDHRAVPADPALRDRRRPGWFQYPGRFPGPGTYVIQAFVVDPDGVGGWASSNGLEIVIP